MLQTLMTRTLRLDCAAVHSTASYISRAQTRKPEVDGGDWRKNATGAQTLFLQSLLSSSCVVSELVQVTDQLA